jgi:hypothetical protein
MLAYSSVFKRFLDITNAGAINLLDEPEASSSEDSVSMETDGSAGERLGDLLGLLDEL